jgi:hypothetical protein
MFPISQVSEPFLSVCIFFLTEIMVFSEDYQQLTFNTMEYTVTADPQVVEADRFSYQQAIHILHHCKQTHCLTEEGWSHH